MLYGQSAYGLGIGQLGPEVGAILETGGTKEDRLARMRASVARYKKQAVAAGPPSVNRFAAKTAAVQAGKARAVAARSSALAAHAAAKRNRGRGGLGAIAQRAAAQRLEQQARGSTGQRAAQLRAAASAKRATAARLARGPGFATMMSRRAKQYGPAALQAAATAASFVPGVGSSVAAGLGAAAALASGKSWQDIAQAAALSALPGGALAQAGAGTALAVARGQRVDRALISGALKVVPGGELGQQAAQAGLAVARGGRIDRAIVKGATGAARSYLSSAVPGLARSALPSGVSNLVPRIPAMPRDLRVSALVRSADPLRGGRLGPIGRPPGFGPVGARLARMAIERRPAMATMSPGSVARELGIARRSAVDAMKRARPLQWRPLRGAAPALVKRYARNWPSRWLSRRDTQGLAPDGATWTIEKGDTLSAIAKKLVDDAARWREFLPANPGVKRHPSWGLEVYTGDVIAIPASWRPDVSPPASVLTAAEVLKSKAILKAWSMTDGQDQPGVTDYGLRPEDLSPQWGPRERLMLASFSGWKGGLPTDGDLAQVHVDALADWAEQRAGMKRPLPVPPIELPEEVIVADPRPPPPVLALPPPAALPPIVAMPSLPTVPGVSPPGPVPPPPPDAYLSPPIAKKSSAGAGTFAALIAAAYFLI